MMDETRQRAEAFWKEINGLAPDFPVSLNVENREIDAIEKALGKYYDAATARADRAEAACAELSFALGIAYAACKENGVTITEDCERTIVAALNNEAGKALLSQRDTLQAELALSNGALENANKEIHRLRSGLAEKTILANQAKRIDGLEKELADVNGFLPLLTGDSYPKETALLQMREELARVRGELAAKEAFKEEVEVVAQVNGWPGYSQGGHPAKYLNDTIAELQAKVTIQPSRGEQG